jgi:hypothetical protein
MFRRTLIATLVLSAILGVGLALAQSSPPASPPAAPTEQPAPAAPAAQVAPAPVKPPVIYYEKARIVVDGKAEANGSLGMTFTAQGGERKSFLVNVLGKTEKNDVARDIHKELSIAVGSAYKVKLDGQKVHISKADKEKTPNFSISIDKIELGGISVRVEKD